MKSSEEEREHAEKLMKYQVFPKCLCPSLVSSSESSKFLCDFVFGLNI